MKRYEQHCPVARAVELLGEPWTLLIVRELLRGSERISEIARGVPRMSSSVLSVRLKTLRGAGLVERLPGDQAGSRYRLTTAGRELRPVVEHLGRWGRRWLPAPAPGDLDPGLLVFDISRDLHRDRLPERPVSVQVDFVDGPPPRRWWLVLSRTATAARDTDPGLPVSVRLECALAALTDVWLGQTRWSDAVGDRRIRLTGDRDAVRAVIDWLGVSRYAPVPRATPGRPVPARSTNGAQPKARHRPRPAAARSGDNHLP